MSRVNKLKSFLNLSIFGRTFLLMLAALIVSEGIGLVLILKRPPPHNHPVTIYELAEQLGDNKQHSDKGPPDDHKPFNYDKPAFDDAPFGEPPTDSSSPPNFTRQGLPPLDGTPQPSEKANSELRVHTATMPPAAPANIDRIGSDITRKRLATLLGVEANSLRVYVTQNRNFMGSPPIKESGLAEGFIVARQLENGSWRIAESVVSVFLSPFEKHALILFSVGMLCLLPLAWIFSQALANPIAQFSKAAKRLGADLNSSPLPVEGPKEILVAIESFNAMQERINSLLRERTEMIASIAHDLRTPLTRLAFRLDGLPSPLNEKVNADIQEMKSMISLALDFIRDRSQSGRREKLDFRLLVESVVDDQLDLGRDVTLTGEASITLEGDPLALRRAIMNVVDNAIKYGERARLQMTTTPTHCVLDIDDDGAGINESLHKRVFEPFFRVESSRNRDTGGVGLGLAVVKAVISEHAGEIQLRNRNPKGLRVTIKLPIAGY
jgi:two-component system OmpR family sensor kinase